MCCCESQMARLCSFSQKHLLLSSKLIQCLMGLWSFPKAGKLAGLLLFYVFGWKSLGVLLVVCIRDAFWQAPAPDRAKPNQCRKAVNLMYHPGAPFPPALNFEFSYIFCLLSPTSSLNLACWAPFSLINFGSIRLCCFIPQNHPGSKSPPNPPKLFWKMKMT